jgi:K+-sensing histidine kinase KdpD
MVPMSMVSSGRPTFGHGRWNDEARPRIGDRIADRSVALLQGSVTDTGVGIAPEDRAKIFEPFSRAHAASWRTFRWRGVGLGDLCSTGAADGERSLSSANATAAVRFVLLRTSGSRERDLG